MAEKAARRRPTAAQLAEQARRTRRRLAWAGMLAGTLVSVAFNIKHAIQVDDPMAWVAAFVWPVFAGIAVELLIRMEWPKGLGWVLARFAGVGVVAVGAMKLSLTHVCAVLESWHFAQDDAITGAVVIDGLMLLSGAALLAMNATPKRRTRKRTRVRATSPATPVPSLTLATASA